MYSYSIEDCCYAPYPVSFLYNFACLTSNFVSVIDMQVGINFHKDLVLQCKQRRIERKD